MLQTPPSMVVRKKLPRKKRKRSTKDALDRCMSKGIINSIMLMINFGRTTLDQNNEAQSSIPNNEHKRHNCCTSRYGPTTAYVLCRRGVHGCVGPTDPRTALRPTRAPCSPCRPSVFGPGSSRRAVAGTPPGSSSFCSARAPTGSSASEGETSWGLL